MSLTLERSEFAKLGKQLRNIKRQSAAEFLAAQAKTLSRYLIQATPPFGENPYGKRVYAKQKEIGIAGIMRDFSASFQPFSVSKIEKLCVRWSKHARRDIRKLANAGLIGQLKNLLHRLGFPYRYDILRNVTTEFCRQNISFGRHPHGIRHKYFVIDYSSVRKERDIAIAHLGRAKAGWLAAANRFQYLEAPAWVKRHQGIYSGEVIDDIFDPTLPSLTMINPNKGADASDSDVDIVERSMAVLQLTNQKQFDSIMAKKKLR